MWKALDEGLIDMVATDHSPCPPEMKYLMKAAGTRPGAGIASLGLALPVVWTGMRQRALPLERVGQWMSAAPARLAGLEGRKGSLAAGCDADLVVFDPDAEWSVVPEDLHFRHKLSPYLGAKLKGRVLETWLRGDRVFQRVEFIGEPRGRELVCK